MTRFAVGIGARSGVRTAAVRALLEQVLTGHGLDPSGAVFATVAARADEPGLREALGTGADVIVWRPDELAAEPVPHPSGRVAAAVGTPSVAEAAALRTARTFPGAIGADLVVPKTVGDGVTVAVAWPAVAWPAAAGPSPSRRRASGSSDPVPGER